ncbi:NADH-ubiquinone oxidoreductase-F iron-sulfur binding region domain-containing protein, partial [Nocardia asiatica]|uniref:NADH-ubiquinone oxidoreductase-F iron-sulfur binding region domain-containing protein n=1 Tax=Nocardia asiatica TaxID=209252 RepID=UPI002456A767
RGAACPSARGGGGGGAGARGPRPPTAADIERLERWSVVLRGRGACGTLDGAANAAATLLARFAPEVAAHLEGRCPTCASGVYSADRPFEVEAVLPA